MAKRVVKKRRKHKEFLIRILMIIVIAIVVFITYKFISNLQIIKVKDEQSALFQYVMEEKREYNGILEMSGKNDISKLTTTEGDIYLEPVPVYYNDRSDKVILPNEMAVVFPLDKSIKKINSLFTAYVKYGDVYVSKGSLNRLLKDSFLYDGKSLYFFIETTIVTIDGTQYKLSPLSYANITYKGYVELYDYDTDKLIHIEKVNEDVTARTSNYSMNLTNNTIKVGDVEQILLKRMKNLINLENE